MTDKVSGAVRRKKAHISGLMAAKEAVKASSSIKDALRRIVSLIDNANKEIGTPPT